MFEKAIDDAPDHVFARNLQLRRKQQIPRTIKSILTPAVGPDERLDYLWSTKAFIFPIIRAGSLSARSPPRV
jgi:hypothetical protein